MLKDDMSISINQLTELVSWTTCVFFSILPEEENEEWGGKYNDKNN